MKCPHLVGLALTQTLLVGALAGNLDATVTTPTGQPVEDAAVVLEPMSGIAPKRGTRVTIEQRGREFVPHMTVIQTGTLVDFPNRDPVKHHVYSFSPAKQFEIKLYSGKPSQPVLFDKPGEVALGCNIHDWMEAYVLVVDSPYFSKTDASGRAVVRDVPAGRYRLRVWHPQQKTSPPQRELDMADATVRVKTALELTPRTSRPKPSSDAEKY